MRLFCFLFKLKQKYPYISYTHSRVTLSVGHRLSGKGSLDSYYYYYNITFHLAAFLNMFSLSLYNF